MLVAETFHRRVSDMLAEVFSSQRDKIEQAASWCADCLRKGGWIHTFGTGHSHLLAEEVFHRAGGLVPLNAILEPSLMLHEGGEKSSLMERLPGLAEVILATQPVRAGDVLFVFSNSGRNAVPIEMAQGARARGLKVVGVTSFAHTESVASRHPSGLKLKDVVDLAIDNGGVPGDAALELPGSAARVGATSTIVGAFIIQAIMAETAARLAVAGEEPPVIMSGNLDAAEEHNARVRARYAERLASRAAHGGGAAR